MSRTVVERLGTIIEYGELQVGYGNIKMIDVTIQNEDKTFKVTLTESDFLFRNLVRDMALAGVSGEFLERMEDIVDLQREEAVADFEMNQDL